MKPRDRAIIAIRRSGVPDHVPHFERFELTQELFGRAVLTPQALNGLTAAERERQVAENAELFARVAERFDYAIVRIWGIEGTPEEPELIRRVCRLVGDRRLVAVSADGTFGIPSGEQMAEFCYQLADRPEEVHELYRRRQAETAARIRRVVAAGAECIYMNSDYCFNSGPFLRPALFAEFVTPYLRQQVTVTHQEGALAIKHTDGNILPILEELLACEVDVIQSLDPQAGIDLAEVKRLVGNRVCLAGNVNCALVQSGTPEEVTREAIATMAKGKPGGGYIFMSSNTIFEGVPLANYLAMWEVWRHYGVYV